MGGEDLTFLSRKGCVGRDHLAEGSSEGFNAQGQRYNIQEEKITPSPGEQMSLDGCTDCNNFVRINRHMRRPAEKSLDSLADCRNQG